VDGHSTHTSYQLSDLCSQLNIILVCLYGNSTRILQPADVSTFKPLKSYWKKGVLDWRRQHNSEALTQEKFAPILQIVMNTYMKPEIIQNGFITTGLCPWNPNAIDYSKCLGKINTDPIPKKNEATAISYSRFKELVGDNLIRKLKTADPATKAESKEFWVLQKLLNEYGLATDENNSDAVDVVTTELDECDTNNITDEGFNFEEMPIIFQGGSQMCSPLKEKLSGPPVVTENEFATEDLFNKANELDESRISTPLKKELSPTFSLVTESAVLTNDLSNEALGNISNASSIKDYLVWPESPIRKGNRNSERMPFVLTSEQWKNLQAEKREKKNNTEKEKEERKRKRRQKKEENELEKLNKKKFKDKKQ
jgi:hypothetical protein